MNWNTLIFFAKLSGHLSHQSFVSKVKSDLQGQTEALMWKVEDGLGQVRRRWAATWRLWRATTIGQGRTAISEQVQGGAGRSFRGIQSRTPQVIYDKWKFRETVGRSETLGETFRGILLQFTHSFIQHRLSLPLMLHFEEWTGLGHIIFWGWKKL